MDFLIFLPVHNVISILLSALVIYILLIIYTRIVGLRSFSTMSSFDFAITISIGAMVASTILSQNISLLEGAAGLAALYILKYIVAYLRTKINFIH